MYLLSASFHATIYGLHNSLESLKTIEYITYKKRILMCDFNKQDQVSILDRPCKVPRASTKSLKTTGRIRILPSPGLGEALKGVESESGTDNRDCDISKIGTMHASRHRFYQSYLHLTTTKSKAPDHPSVVSPKYPISSSDN